MPILLILIGIRPVFGQNTDVNSGIEAYDRGLNDQAINYLDKALSEPSGLESQEIPKAYFYRARAKLTIYQDAVSVEDFEESREKEQFFISAFEDYKKSREMDDGNWQAKIRADLRVVSSNALQRALTLLNKSYTALETIKSQLVTGAERMIDIALEIDPSFYVGHDIYGQILFEKKRITEAIAQFDIAQEQYPKYGQIDFMIGYTHYRSALGFRSMGQLQSALDEISGGIDQLDSDYNKYKTSSNKTDRSDQQYRRVRSDLKNLELDIYLNYPEKLTDAIAKFEEDLKSDPGNYRKAVAYASLLERADPLKAIDAYLEAIEIDPAKEEANFNLGVLYNNLAAELTEQAAKQIDNRKASQMQYEAKNQMTNALLYFEEALKANESLRTVVALKQITKFLDLEEKHQFYVFKEAQLLKK